ncbi:hypothetical protein RRG08_031181 [Elysia crispata]|uniref:Uncharacterized protein n=1 Tax=Elysia crispata TaxID=231223 RepID=A0AAE0ZFJ5_9GAST|nr:hypothetical protein RRG08_031181 [Elysia crispata]
MSRRQGSKLKRGEYWLHWSSSGQDTRENSRPVQTGKPNAFELLSLRLSFVYPTCARQKPGGFPGFPDRSKPSEPVSDLAAAAQCLSHYTFWCGFWTRSRTKFSKLRPHSGAVRLDVVRASSLDLAPCF